jgi:hypothetical protein
MQGMNEGLAHCSTEDQTKILGENAASPLAFLEERWDEMPNLRTVFRLPA